MKVEALLESVLALEIGYVVNVGTYKQLHNDGWSRRSEGGGQITIELITKNQDTIEFTISTSNGSIYGDILDKVYKLANSVPDRNNFVSLKEKDESN